MEAQNFANHRRNVPIYHFILFPLIALTLIGSLVNLYQSWGDHQRQYSASLIVVIMAAVFVLQVLCAAGIAYAGEPGPVLVGLVRLLGFSAFQFIRLLRMLHARSDAA